MLRHRHRPRNPQGRLVAALEDYATVYNLVAEMYEAAVTGASRAVRETVEGVRFLKDHGTPRVTASGLARHLGVSTMAISRSARTATKHGWLVNREARKGYPADLDVGEPLPALTGLPSPAELGVPSGPQVGVGEV